MIARAFSHALLVSLLLGALPAGAQEDADDEWGDDEGPVLGDEPTAPPSPDDLEAVTRDEEEAAPAEEPGPPPADAPRAEPPREEPAAAEPADLDDADDRVAGGFVRRVGDPLPLTMREPLLPSLGVEVDIRYGLVGTGPTRFINDIRFGVFDWLELRTALAPYPASLMARVGIGAAQSPLGVLLLEGGLAHLDAGLRLVPDEGEAEVGIRAHFEAIVAYQLAFLDRFAFYTAAHLRSRLSMLSNDEQHAFAASAALTYDLLPYLAVTGGVGYAQALFGSPVREIAVNFVEHDRPGMSHFLVRDDLATESLTVPLALTYGRVENFDVDLFATTRVWPKLDIVFGAGVRWRWGFGRKPWEPVTEG